MSTLICLALIASLPQATSATQPLEPTVSFVTLLEELCDPDRLARLPEPACSWHQLSNAPRSEAHGERRENVLLDVDGPGAIVSIESTAPAGTLRVYLDELEEPVLESPLEALLGGRGPIAAPLAEACARGGVLHLPIPYARHCRLTCDAPAAPPYHVEYRTYAPGTPVESLRAQDLATRELAGAVRCWQRLDNERGDTSFTYSLARQVPEGALLCSAPKDAAGPHAITNMQFMVEAPDLTRALRELVVRMRFDGEETVACPFGDLFGAAPGLNVFRSVPISVREGGVFNCRWTMPYRERFELVIENHGSPDTHVAGALRTEPWAWDERSLYFHARWRRSGPISTRPIRDLERIAIEGRGVFVGGTLSIANPTSVWWGGGDEQLDVDGRTARWSTGDADDCGDAGCSEAPRDNALIVRARRDGPAHFGWTSRARWRALDAIPFERSLRYAVELAHRKEVDVDLCSAQFYYARPGARDDAPAIGKEALALPDIAARLPRVAGALEAEALSVIADTSGGSRRQVLEDIDGGSCSGLEQLAVRATSAGQSIELLLPIARPGRRELVVYLTKSSAYGALQFYVDGRRAGPTFDAFDAASERPAIAAPQALGSFELGPQARLRVETIDRNPPSPAAQFSFGIDCVVVR